MQQFLALAPEALLIVGALVVLFAELYGGDRAAAIVGTVTAAAAAILVWLIPAPAEMFGGMLHFGAGTATATLRSTIAGLSAIMLLWVVARGWAGFNAREAVSLMMFSTVGGMLLISANDLVMLFMALELATLPAYVLIGYAREDERGLEGALKYFLISMLMSLLMAYGLSFVFGLTGTTAYQAIPASSGALGLLAGILVAAGFLTKTTATPFHFWSPDAYGGSSPTSVAYVSAIAKVGAVWAFARFFIVVLPGMKPLLFILLGASVLSMVLGNFVAIIQPDIRRIMAYSGIGNIGYMLLGISSGSVEGAAGAVFFVVVYAVGMVGQMLVVAQEGPTLKDVAGLVHRRPYAAWCSVGFLFSLIGFPPLVGFFGKLAVFSAAYDAGYGWAVAVAIVVSVVSAGYAFNIIRTMFTPGEGTSQGWHGPKPRLRELYGIRGEALPGDWDRPMLEETTTYKQYPALAATVIFVLTFLVIGLGIVAQPLIQMLGVGLP
jgi:NADH-quinone oxidoreductase subunit N